MSAPVAARQELRRRHPSCNFYSINQRLIAINLSARRFSLRSGSAKMTVGFVECRTRFWSKPHMILDHCLVHGGMAMQISVADSKAQLTDLVRRAEAELDRTELFGPARVMVGIRSECWLDGRVEPGHDERSAATPQGGWLSPCRSRARRCGTARKAGCRACPRGRAAFRGSRCGVPHRASASRRYRASHNP